MYGPCPDIQFVALSFLDIGSDCGIEIEKRI
jgi:hypothetical protein